MRLCYAYCCFVDACVQRVLRGDHHYHPHSSSFERSLSLSEAVLKETPRGICKKNRSRPDDARHDEPPEISSPSLDDNHKQVRPASCRFEIPLRSGHTRDLSHPSGNKLTQQAHPRDSLWYQDKTRRTKHEVIQPTKPGSKRLLERDTQRASKPTLISDPAHRDTPTLTQQAQQAHSRNTWYLRD